jgi:hypothetical protein
MHFPLTHAWPEGQEGLQEFKLELPLLEFEPFPPGKLGMLIQFPKMQIWSLLHDLEPQLLFISELFDELELTILFWVEMLKMLLKLEKISKHWPNKQMLDPEQFKD